MAIRLMHECWRRKFEQKSDREILMVLCDHANEDGICWPSQGYVEWATDYSRETIKASYRRLRAAGALETVRQSGGRGQVPILRVNPFALPAKPPRERGEPDNPLLAQKGGSSSQEGGKQLPPRTVREPSKEPTFGAENSKEESAKPKPTRQQRVMDAIYDALKAERLRLSRDEYSHNLGRVKEMLEKDEPTDAELEALPEACAEYFDWYGNLDVVFALRRHRQQARRGLRESESAEKWRQPEVRHPQDRRGPDPELLEMQRRMLEEE